MAIPFNLPDIGRRIYPEETGVPDYISALSKGFKLGYEPRNLENTAYAAELANKIKEPYAQNALRVFEADIGGQEATGGLTRENTLKQKILNEFLRQREPAEIAEIRAREKYYRTGGSGGSTGSKDYNNYVNGVATDNPDLNQEQLQEAADVLARGGNRLMDGTILKPMSFGTNQAFNRTVKSGTTAAQVNQANYANQAHAELKEFTRIADEYRKPYATTIYGKSPQQIIDSFKNDDTSQTNLGKLIAANALEFDIAQARNRIAAGQPGITSTNQMMTEAQQHINTVWPRLSGKARSAANKYLNEALEKGLNARNKIGVGAGSAYTRQHQQNNNPNNNVQKPGRLSVDPTTHDIPPGWVALYMGNDPEPFVFPPDQVDKKLSEGYTYE